MSTRLWEACLTPPRKNQPWFTELEEAFDESIDNMATYTDSTKIHRLKAWFRSRYDSLRRKYPIE